MLRLEERAGENVKNLSCWLANWIALTSAAALAGQAIRFEARTIASNLPGGYQVVASDMNRDGKPDLIALASDSTELIWFENRSPENPGWQRHVIVKGLNGMINLAAADVDADGIPEIALAYGFSMNAARSSGVVALLHHASDPRQVWEMRQIDRLPTSHRLRWADIDGSGKPVLINAPLSAPDALAPDYRGHVPLVYYRPGNWTRQLIGDAEEGIVHGIFVTDWDGHGRADILIGGFLGIHLYRYGAAGLWTRAAIANGDPAAWPKGGTSDVAVGKLRGERFLAALEPWHGNQVAVYRQARGAWQREVIDRTLLDGHTIATGDFDRDGSDEIVAGFRGKPYGVYLYRFDGQHWNRQILDIGDMSAAACTVADLDADGRPDLACIGSGTHNLKWYRNAARESSLNR